MWTASRIPILLAVALLSQSLLETSSMRLHRAKPRKDANQNGTDCYSGYDGQILLEVSPCETSEVDEMNALIAGGGCNELGDDGLVGLSVSSVSGCDSEMMMCDATVAEELAKRFGSHVTIISKDAGAYWRQLSGTTEPYVPQVSIQGIASTTSDFYTKWRDFADQESYVQSLVEASGGLAKIETIGRSFENRPIKAVRLTGSGYARGKPKLLFSFLVHPREWMSGMAGVYALEKMIARAKADPSWIAGVQLVLVPISNPDGFIYTTTTSRYWRKNRRSISNSRCDGVDLNRNFDANWGGAGSSTNPCSDVYQGGSANSEPESKALATLVNEGPLTVHVDVHAFSELILSPWGYTKAPHPRKAEIDDLGTKMQSAIKAKHGKTFQLGSAAAILYAASGGFGDYSTKMGALGYTYEVRPGRRSGQWGFSPPASEILPGVEETLEGLYAAIAWSKDGASSPAPSPAPTPAPGLSCPSSAVNPTPDSDGDCECPANTWCSTKASYTRDCPYSGGIGGSTGRFFVHTCTSCKCYRSR